MQTTRRNTVHDVLLKNAVGLLALVATGLFGISNVTAQVVLDDGETHIINDASYEFAQIEVRNGSTLRIQDGAVIAAPIDPPYDFDSGLPVLEFSTAAIQAFDTSKVIVEGGVFGGDRLGTPGPNFLDNWYSGSIAAFEEAEVMVEDGTFGACAFRSGSIVMFDEARLLVSGGTFAAPGGTNPGGLGCQAGGGRIELWKNSSARVLDGLHASSINAEHSSTVDISGGSFGADNGGGRGVVSANTETPADSATVKISGGQFGAAGPFSGTIGLNGRATAEISGGTFGGTGPQAGAVLIADSAFVSVTGGQFNGSAIAVDPGGARIEGCEFNLPFGSVVLASHNLVGVLASGDLIDVTLTRELSTDAVIDLIETPCGAPPVSFLRGDCNDDGAVNVADATCSLGYLFGTGAEPGCLNVLNTNGDSKIDIADPIALLDFLFGGGTIMSAPFPECGPGMLSADEEIGCANPTACQ